MKRPRELVVEGVTHRRYRVEFKTNTGKRVKVFLWSPGHPWLRSEVARMLDERGDVPEGSDVLVSEA